MKSGTIRVLHLEDNQLDQMLVKNMLESDGLSCEFRSVQSRVDFESALVRDRFDLIISDFTLPAFDGLSGLHLARQLAPKTPFIFFSGTIGEEAAVESLKKGASDYVIKHRPNRLAPAIRNTLQLAAARAQQEEARNRYREQAELLDKARDAILVCDLNHRIIHWNEGAERIYGWTAAEATGKYLAQLIFQERSPGELLESLRRVNEQGEWVGELEQYTKDGRAMTIRSRATLIRDELGKPKSLLIINNDATESRQLEEKFLRAQRMESLGVLVSGIAHDLNNALAPILIGIEVVRKDGGADEGVLSAMEQSARHGAEMVKQILAFVRGSDAKKRRMNLGQLLKEMVKVFEVTFGRGIHCELEPGEELWPVSAIATQIYQVLMNLGINAKDAMPDGGRLVLGAHNIQVYADMAAKYPGAKAGDYLRVSVRDSGCGIPPDKLEKIFEPFFTTKPIGKGTGLGLYTSLDIVKHHGGFMTVNSEVGRGTEFCFFLPVTDKEPETKPLEELPLPAGHGEGVMVVDNDAIVVALTHTTLENFGYRPISARTAWDAVSCLGQSESNVQLAIVDVNMQFIGNLTAAIVVRNTHNRIKMIITGTSEREVPQEMRERLKADAYVTKPFTMEKLLQTIHQVLTRK